MKTGLKIPVGAAVFVALALAGLMGMFAFNAAPPAEAQTTGQCSKVGDNYDCTYTEHGTGMVYDFHATDQDRGGVVIWEKVTAGDDATTYPDHGAFDIDRDTGVLTFKNPPDYEMAMDDGDDNVYMVKVKAGDGKRTFAEIGVTVTVRNMEEDGTVSLSNLQPQVRVPLMAMLDDPDGSATISGWVWSRSARSRGSYTTIAGATEESYTPVSSDVGMHLRATATYVDGHGEGHDTAMAMSMHPVRAYPDDDNVMPMFAEDDAPDTDGNTATRKIDENTSAGMNVGPPVVATDDNDDVLTYSLGMDADNLKFDIDQVTGQIMTKVEMDADVGVEGADDNCARENACSVVVTAMDPFGGTDTITVTITVNDLNETPKVTGPTVIEYVELGDTQSTPTLLKLDGDPDAEDQQDATYTADDDGPDNAIMWELSGPDADKFWLGTDANPDNGATSPALQFRSAPNFEKPGDADEDKIYEVTVVARDGMWATGARDVTVKVTDVKETGTVTLSHVQPEVNVPLEATLNDPDGSRKNVSWQWYWTDATNDDNEISGAKSDTYTPRAIGPGDSPTAAPLAVKVTYTDAASDKDDRGTDMDESMETAMITSGNVVRASVQSNPRPKFVVDGTDATATAKTYTRYVRENRDASTGVSLTMANAAQATADIADADVTATDDNDADAANVNGDQDALQYELGGTDKAYFSIDQTADRENAVTIETKEELDYEKKQSYTVEVKATDPSGGFAKVTVNIRVVDEDEAPKITGPNMIETYMENGTAAVATYTAKDPEGTAVNWTLLGNNGEVATFDVEDFEVTQKSGPRTMLGFKEMPDYEDPEGGAVLTADAATKGNIYTVQLRAAVINPANANNITETEMDAETVMVRVTNVEEAPDFKKSTDTLTVEENVDVNTDIDAPVTAKDGDGDALTYSLGGRDADSFTIIPATGQIKRKAELDYETKDSYSVVVTATDPGGLTDTINVTISVEDVPEKPTITEGGLSVSGPPRVSYAENGTGTDALGTYTAEGENAEMASWTREGDDAGDFMLEGSGMSRMLKFSTPPDYETPADANTDNVYMVTVKVSYGTGEDMEMGTHDVAVTVTDADDMGTVTVMPMPARMGVELTASLDDPDMPQTITMWDWWINDTMEGDYTMVPDELTSMYTPTDDDVGKYLKARVTYTDGTFGQEQLGSDPIMVLSSDATLSALSLMDGDTEITLAMVADMPMKRTASVGNDVESVTVTATPNDMENAMAVIMPADADMDMDGHQVALMVGANEITVTVTAQDGETMMTYMVTVTRAASMDASLMSLDLWRAPDDEVGNLTTIFMTGTTEYTVMALNSDESVTVKAIPTHMGATVEVNGTAVDADGTAAVDLDVGMNTITAMVTAQDGETMMTYTITVTRAASMDASLSALSLMDGDTEITLAMVADMPMKRTASVGNDVESVTVTATPNDMENAMAVIMPADADMDMDGHQVDLAVGDTEITVTVTAQDGTTMMTYMVTVTRAAPADPLLDKYDADDDGSFSREEVEQAITRYFNNEAGVTQDDVIAVITRYLAGS